MVVSILEYVAICTSLANENGAPNGWEKNTNIDQAYYTNNENGFKGCIYEKINANGEKDVVIAFNCMDDNDWNDKIDAFLILNNMQPNQYNDAWNLYLQAFEYYRNQNVTIHFTGWSLGGALAQLMGKDTLIDTVTLSAPGMANYLDDPGLYKGYTNITNYCIMNDPIGNANQHIGITYLIEPVPISTNIISDAHQYSTNYFNIETNNYKYILKPEDWTNNHTMALIKYDINFNISTLLNNSYLISTYGQTNENDLKYALNIINLQMGATSNVLHYKTQNTDYVIGTDNDENGTNVLTGSELYIDTSSGSDIIWGNGGNDEIYGLSGNDILIGDSTTLTIQELENLKNSNQEINIVYFESENDGNDYLNGGAGNDLLVGGGGNDILVGGNDKDTLYGGSGNDLLIAGDSTKTVGELQNILNNSSNISASDYESDTKENTLYGGIGNDILIGDKGNDTLYGGDDDDIIYGGKGDDVIYGDDQNNVYQGNDVLYGGEGSDTLYGGKGDDLLIAGSTSLSAESP